MSPHALRLRFGGHAHEDGDFRVLSGRRSAQEFLIRIFDTLESWHERAVQRLLLMSMDDRVLSDIGADRSDIVREASKPFWRA